MTTPRADQAIGRDAARVGARARLEEALTWDVLWRVEKYADQAAFERGDVDEVVEFQHNLLLNEGITRLLQLLTGTTTNPYNNANARLGVGNSTTAAAASQTALQGASTAFKAMDATFPQVGGQTATFKATFLAADGNFAWEEFTIDNGNTANENLNRKVQSLGTKVSPAVWTLTATVTIS